MFQYAYLYLALAVIVIVGLGVVGVMLIRRGRRAVDEDMFAAAPGDVSVEAGEPAAVEPARSIWVEPVGSTWVAPESETAAEVESGLTGIGALLTGKPESAAPPAPAPIPAPAPAPEPNYLEGVENLLAEWRTKHELAASHTACQEAAHADELRQAEEARAALLGAPCPSPDEQHPAAGLPPATGAESPAGAEGAAADELRSAPAVAAYAAPAAKQTLPVPEAGDYDSWESDPASEQAMTLVDPLGTVILDLLDGMGKLTAGELKRLEVFRPERIDLAVQTLQLPARLQGDEDAALRLAQIRLYAATLELRSKWSAQMSRRPDRAGDTPYSARDFKLKIARDIMYLPAPDRSEVIGFLLGGLLNSPGSTPELKRAVIDTLEHLRSTSLVNVLLDCLDDPDPIVQEYALAAADRLLDD
jgi:hypothetical protein